MKKGKICYLNWQGFLLKHWQGVKLWLRFATDATDSANAGSIFFLFFFFFANRECRTPECPTAISLNSIWILSLKIDCTECFRCRQCHVQATSFWNWNWLVQILCFFFFLVVFLFYMLLSFLLLVFFVIIIIIIIILDQIAFTHEIILLNKGNQRKTRTKNLGKKNMTQKEARKKGKWVCPLP